MPNIWPGLAGATSPALSCVKQRPNRRQRHTFSTLALLRALRPWPIPFGTEKADAGAWFKPVAQPAQRADKRIRQKFCAHR